MAEAKPTPTLGFVKTIRHGFPENPSCIAYDCVQDLVAFGSQNGEVVVIGRPQLETRFEAPSGVLDIQFSINKGVVIVYCNDHTCYFWSIRTSFPQLLGEFKMPAKESSVVLYWPYNSNTVYVGTSNGNILFVTVELTVISGAIVNTNILPCKETIYWNKVTTPSQGFRRDHPGEIRSIEEHPSEPDKILIAYSLGLCIVWNLKSKEVDYRHQHMELECASWYGENGKMYVICTSEGQITRVKLKKNEEKILHQCPGVGSVTNLQSYTIKQDKWLLFVQCTLLDKIYTTSIIVLGEKQQITSLSFDQPIVNFMCIPSSPFKSEKQNSKALVVLQTKKLVVYDMTCDLSSKRALPFHVPFSFNLLSSSIVVLHNGGHCLSPITVDKLMVMKSKIPRRHKKHYSSNKWPFEGGEAWKKENGPDSCSPVLLATSHANELDSITFWLYCCDMLENLFTIETAKLFPLNYSCPSKQPTSIDIASSTEEEVKRKEDVEVKRKQDVEVKSKVDVGAISELDVKFLTMNMKEETIVFINNRGNVLIYNFGRLQPDHEQTITTEIVLNAVEEVDSPTQGKRNLLPWRFWAANDVPQVHLLHHVCCVVDWEDNIQVVPIESAVYNDEIKMLLLGTHIAMVLVDLKNKGTIIIDTLKTLKSLGSSSVTSCEKRMVVESKKKMKFDVLKKFGTKKIKSKSLLSPSHDATPFCSSIVDIVFFITNTREQPSLTIWMGTESGDLAAYKVIRNPLNDQEIQVKSTGIILQQKESINGLIFFTENFQKIHSNIPWHCSLQESQQSNETEPYNPVVLNYVVIQSTYKLKCYGFPTKKITPISKHKETRCEIMKSTFMRLRDNPYLLMVLSNGELVILSLPDLIQITSLCVTNDISMSELKSLSFNETGHGMYISKEFEIQRVTIDMRPPQEEDDEIDGSSSIHAYPLTYVPRSDPMIPKSTSRIISRGIVSKSGSPNISARNDWFTPHKPFAGGRGARNNKDRLTKSVPSHYKSNIGGTSQQTEASKPKIDVSSTFDRTAQALDERGKRLNNAVETTNKLLLMAEIYAENVAGQNSKSK